MEEMEDKRFDQEIRSWFEHFKVDYQPQHWDVMQEKLDAFSYQADSAFDDAINDKLGNFQATQIHSDWSRMESLLDKSRSLTDEEFDRQIAHQLDNVRPPYNPQYWHRIEEMRLNRTNRLIQFSLLRTAEIMMLFLLWFNWPAGSIESPAIRSDIEYAVESLHDNEIVMSGGVAAPDATNQSRAILGSVASSGLGQVDREDILNTRGLQMESGSSDSREEFVAEDAQEVSRHDDLFIPPVASLERLPIFGLGEKSKESIETRRMQDALPELQANTSLVLPLNIPEYDHSESEKKVSFSPYVAADFNAINSYLGIEKLEDNRLRHLTLTPGVGLGVGFHNGPWSVHTGAGYSYKFYDPNITEQFGSIEGYSELNFNKVALHVLQLPIRLQYKVREGMKSAFYVTGGASLHYIVRQEFEKPKRPISSVESIPSPVRPIFEEGQYKSGNFLGRFSESSYITADLGIGMEYKLNNDLVMYVQPTYMRMFGQGVGPNYDVIHSVSLQIGLRL
jgi:hypothetical protein